MFAGELEMTFNTSEVAVCCSHDTRSLAHYLGHRKEVGAPGEFENLTDAELERALVERLARLGLTGDAGSDTPATKIGRL
jgi:hypothetical protein